jgi:hypothetical protein
MLPARATGHELKTPWRKGGHGNDDDDVKEDPPGGGSGACEMTTVVKFVPRSYFDPSYCASWHGRVPTMHPL